jgi:hypothetical protein
MTTETPETPPKPRFYLRDLPLSARVVLAVFLISVGIGYLSALVQLHFQQALAGELLPAPPQVISTYHGERGLGQLERLIVTDENKPFTGSGSMRSAFTSRSAGWKPRLKKVPEKDLRESRDWEIDSVVAWIHDGHKKENWDEFKFLVPEAATNQINARKAKDQSFEPEDTFFKQDDSDPKKWWVNIESILMTRCARCHATGKGGAAGQIHLDAYENVVAYIPPDPDTHGNGHSLTKLAQSTHVHLLGFSMLYGMTGLIFAFTSYPGFLRLLIAPAPLIAQIVDISFWWLARMDEPYGPMFAQAIMISGGVVAITLFIQISMGLMNLFATGGRILLFLLAVGVVAVGVGVGKPMLEKYLANEKAGTVLNR